MFKIPSPYNLYSVKWGHAQLSLVLVKHICLKSLAHTIYIIYIYKACLSNTHAKVIIDLCDYCNSMSPSVKHLNNLGIQLTNWQNLFGKIDYVYVSIWKNLFSTAKKKRLKNRLVFLKYSKKSIFIGQGRLHTLQ